MKRIIVTRLFLVIILFSWHTYAGAHNFTIRHLGVERGLSNNHVVGIAQDKQGFIWIATDEGLNRFDGHSFRTFFKDGPGAASLTGNELNDILDDPKLSILWIATQRSGLNSYNYETGKFSSYVHSDNEPSSLITDDVTSLAPAADGGIWVTTFWRGIDHLNPETGVFTHYNSTNVKGLPDVAVWSVVDNGDGFLYVAHERGGFSIINLHERTARNFMPDKENQLSLPSADVQCVYKDSLNNIWVGTSAGLALYNQDEGTFVNLSQWHPQLAHSVSDIKQFSGNKLWVAMERGGVAVLEFVEGVFSAPDKAQCEIIEAGDEPNLLSSPSVRCLFEDKFSNVWAGSWGGGLNLICRDRPAFELHAATPQPRRGEVLASSSVFTMLFDNDGRLWVGKDGGGLDVWDGDRKVMRFDKNNGHLPGEIVQASFKSSDGSLWFGFFNAGVVHYNPLTHNFKKLFPPESTVDVRDISADLSGNLLIASSAGVWRYDRKSQWLSGPFNVGNNLIRKIYPLPDGSFLVGTFGSGLIVTDSIFQNQKWIDKNFGFPSNTVNDIFRSRDGHIWVASGEGLVEFADIEQNPKDFKVINRSSGLSNSHVLAITQDRSGLIWISTNGGISCVNGDTVRNYSHRDNVPLGNFLGRSVASDRKGNLYFGGISGLCMFNPVKVVERMALPESVIVEVAVLSNSDSASDTSSVITATGRREVRLTPGRNSFDIYFTTSNYAHACEVEYAYMLEGLDDRWCMALNGNVATFRDVPAGSYTFKVKTRMRNQEWGDPAELKIVLPPPFWAAWWAKTIYVVVAFGVVFVLLYLYRKRVNVEARLKVERADSEARLREEQERHRHEQELNDERLRFYTNITHELRTPLTLIVGPLEDLAKNDKLPEKERRSLRMVHRNACRLLELVNRPLEFRKTETQNRRLCVCRGNIATTVYEVALKYKELNRNSNVAVKVQAESGVMEAIYDKEVVTVILDNLISNAIKYTSKGEVNVSCMQDKGNIVMKVADTGVGISPEAVNHIFERYYQERGPHQATGTGIGLALVKNLVALHHGLISVSARDGGGTEFVVSIPVSDVYPEALHTEEIAETATESLHPQDEDDVTVTSSELKPVVLVVEDNSDIRDYIQQSFTDLYEVKCAEDGKAGFDLALEVMPNVIVSDIMMPVMDGIEMTKRLKGDVRTSHIPVILLTAKDTLSDREEGYESGADSYLTKPFSSSLLQSRINNLLLQRLKLVETFSGRSAPMPSADGNSIEEKRKRLMKSLSEVDKEFVEKLTKTITDNIPSENVDVNFLSGAFCMSASTLYRKVKALTGISPNEFIRKTKMQMAESLLLDGHYTFSEIAFKVGMNSVAYFRQCFKDEFGMTPSEYLRHISGTSGDGCQD